MFKMEKLEKKIEKKTIGKKYIKKNSVGFLKNRHLLISDDFLRNRHLLKGDDFFLKKRNTFLKVMVFKRCRLGQTDTS